jgi:hypothetical protein
MVEIQVSKHDVAYIACGKAKPLNLIECCIFSLKFNVIKMNEERAKPRVRIFNVA